ncbi:MAG TPA: hypothetical protein VMM18_00385 [Gemmatimonadaceae bacterium]|nr:hypothetical protein [Gemmatimonadaceae bacterium]
MGSRIFAVGVLSTFTILSACEAPGPLEPLAPGDGALLASAPADGNGNKTVFTIDVHLPGFTGCPNGMTLDLRIVGWIQELRVEQVPMSVLPGHFEFIYSNAAGDTFVWKQVSVQRFYFAENGDLMLLVAGRLGYDGNIGRLLINITTNTVESVAGREVFAEDLACAALS